MAALASDWLSDWLRHFRLLLWNYWKEFNETWQEAGPQSPLPSLCFIGSIGKTRWRPWLLIGRDIFDFFSETAEWKSRKLDRKHDLYFLYQVGVFRADRKNKMAALASDWLSHFRILLWNFWTEFNESWQEARSQRPLPSLCFIGLIGKTRWRPWPLIVWVIFDLFSETSERNSMKLDRKQDLNVLYQVRVLSGWSEKQDGGPGLWLSDTFLTSSLKPLNGIQRILTRSKISTSSTKFVFFRPRPIGKIRWPSRSVIFSAPEPKAQVHYCDQALSVVRPSVVRPSLTFHIFNFSSETTERNSTTLDRKHDLNVLYQVCVFRVGPKNKMAALASDWLRHFRLLLWNRWLEFNET